jgi:hypothetical protein
MSVNERGCRVFVVKNLVLILAVPSESFFICFESLEQFFSYLATVLYIEGVDVDLKTLKKKSFLLPDQ